MLNYIIRRLLLAIPTLLLLSLIVFITIRFIPGDVIDQIVAENPTWTGVDREEAKEIIRADLGLDKPIHVQYFNWLGGVLRGDLGLSLLTYRPIGPDILSRIPVTVELGLIALITSMCISLPVGIYSAARQDTWGDMVCRVVAILCITMPAFWIGTMVIVFGSVTFGWTPALRYIPITQDFWGNLGQFIIPGVIMGMVMSGTTMRMTRTMMLEVLREDYIRTAWSKGLKERVVILRHGLKNALIPVVTLIGGGIPILIAGSVILEQIFVLPGTGRLLVDALGRRDYPVIQSVNLVIACFVMITNLAVDISYAYLDPRIRYD